MGSPLISTGIGALDSLDFMSRAAQRREWVWKNLHVSPQTVPSKQSFAHISIGLIGLVVCALSPTLSCQWASVNSGLWCSSDLGPILCSSSRAVLPGQPFCATSAGAPFAIHKLWAMSCIVYVIAFISVRSGAQFSGLFQDAAGCMHLFMWHKDQKSVCHCLIALLQKAQT